VTEPLPGGDLAVEGWTTDGAMQAAANEFKTGNYGKLYVVGGPIERGTYLSEYKSWADLGEATLEKIGLPADKVIAVPAPAVRQDRTYAEGRALFRWWEVKGGRPKQLHVFTEGAHARRSRLLFQMALEGQVQVGVTSVPTRSYDPARWWASSAGFRDVSGELLAYIYARVLFRP